MADVVRYVDTDVVGGLGDGTSWANAYSSLSAWETAEDTDLVTDGDTHTVYCRASSGTADTTAFAVDGWDTDSTHWLKIEVLQADRHNGAWDETAHRLYIEDDDAYDVKEEYVYLIGLQAGLHTPTGNGNDGFRIGISEAAGNIWIENCIVKGHDDDTYQSRGIVYAAAVTNAYVKNCAFFDLGQHSFSKGILTDDGNYYFYNITIYNAETGVDGRGGGSILCINVIGDQTSNGAFVDVAASTFVCYNCAADDETAGSHGGSGNRTSQTFMFYSAADGDFHLSASDTGALNFGLNLSTDSNYSFNDDIDGETRDTTWSIGCDEPTAAAAGIEVLRRRMEGL